MVQTNDIVLIYYEDNPLSFARIEAIQPDTKPDWYHVTLLLLQVPVQQVTWILKDIYINGEEFTMNGKRMRLETVINPEQNPSSEGNRKSTHTREAKNRTKVISLNDRRRSK